MIQIEPGSGQECILTPLAELRFFWVGDHWKHEIRSVGQSGAFPLIWSIEGGRDDADHARVVGPTYTKIESKATPFGARATLSGRSGPHHFSAHFDVYEAGDGVVIDVDATDRCETPVEFLAATYTIDDAPEEPTLNRGRLLWDQATHHLILAGKAPTTISAAKAGMRSHKLEAVAAIEPDAQIHHLRYRWRWSNEPETIPPWRLS